MQKKQKSTFWPPVIGDSWFKTSHISYCSPIPPAGIPDLILSDSVILILISHFIPCSTAILHGDRIEGFAFATTCSLMNIRILHIEGGELSGTIDGKLRHCISLLADLHCVSNAECKQNLMDLGISDKNIFITGCPSYDTILQTGIEKQEDDIGYKTIFITDKNYSSFTIFAERFLENIFTTRCHSFMGVSPLDTGSKLWHCTQTSQLLYRRRHSLRSWHRGNTLKLHLKSICRKRFRKISEPTVVNNTTCFNKKSPTAGMEFTK